jgi:hypothetical protein
MKRRMVELAEESARSYAESTLQLNSNIANICSSIQDGFALMREIMYRPPQQTQYVPPHSGQYNSYPSPYMETPPRHTQHNATPMSQFAPTPSQTRTPGNIQDSYRRALLELDDVE